MNSKNVKIIAQSAWREAQGGTVKLRVVVWRQDGPAGANARYATHYECDLESGSPLYFHDGHYDMSMGQAILDFETRCRLHGIGPFPVNEVDMDAEMPISKRRIV